MQNTLLKSLKRTTRKGKTKWKWTGKIAELKDFVALVLEHKGSWKIRRENNKQMHVFEESDCNYVLTWWPSTVMLFQGNADVCNSINAHLEKILNRLQDGDNALDMSKKPKLKLRRRRMRSLERNQA